MLVSKNFYNSFEHKGFVRFIIDKKTLEFDVKTLDYLDFKGFLSDIYESGNVENGYSLDIRDFYFLEDGSIGILMEKFKPEGQYSAPKTTDLVYAYTCLLYTSRCV